MRLNSFTQQECLGSLHRLELLYFCSMIFGYEALNQRRGREEICPTSKDLFFSCSEPALVLGVRSFHPALCKAETNVQPWSQRTCWAEVLLHRRADVKPTSMAGVQHRCPWSQHPTSAAFFAPFLPWHTPCLHPPFSSQKASHSSLVFYLFLWTPDQRFRFLGMK